MSIPLKKSPSSRFAVFSRVKMIPHDDPELTPANWCVLQPCIKLNIASRKVVIGQPLSTCLVYALSLLTICVGLYFFQIDHNESSRFCWGIGLILWGLGALLAGTSYQAFGYAIKCYGRNVCAWTSWWELIYLMLQQVSMNFLLAGVAYSCTTDTLQRALWGYALLSSVVYVSIVFIGGLVPLKALITFELMVWFSMPAVLLCFFLNAYRLFLYKDIMDLALLITWALLFLTMKAYWTYHKRGYAKKLWARGIWFTENDVLHVLLIFWMIYIAVFVANHIEDYSMP